MFKRVYYFSKLIRWFYELKKFLGVTFNSLVSNEWWNSEQLHSLPSYSIFSYYQVWGHSLCNCTQYALCNISMKTLSTVVSFRNYAKTFKAFYTKYGCKPDKKYCQQLILWEQWINSHAIHSWAMRELSLSYGFNFVWITNLPVNWETLIHLQCHETCSK
jgi:hypothetical protein